MAPIHWDVYDLLSCDNETQQDSGFYLESGNTHGYDKLRLDDENHVQASI